MSDTGEEISLLNFSVPTVFSNTVHSIGTSQTIWCGVTAVFLFFFNEQGTSERSFQSSWFVLRFCFFLSFMLSVLRMEIRPVIIDLKFSQCTRNRYNIWAFVVLFIYTRKISWIYHPRVMRDVYFTTVLFECSVKINIVWSTA